MEPTKKKLRLMPKVQGEKTVEAYLVASMKAIGGEAAKWVCPSRRGKPDRICFFPDGLIKFVEVKTEGKKPSPTQIQEFRAMQKIGHEVVVVSTKKSVDFFIMQFHNSTGKL